jgi:glycine C-acetyltransferase
MLCGKLYRNLASELLSIRESGLFKTEWLLQSPQGAAISVAQGTVLNFCANNYLGLGGIRKRSPRSPKSARL